MRKSFKMFGMAAMMGILMMAGGCGSDGDPVTQVTATLAVPATISGGTATTPATTTTTLAPPAGTSTYLDAATVTLPPSTTITAKDAAGNTVPLTAAPSISITAPADASNIVSGVQAVPVPVGFTSVASTAGAINISLVGAASATFSPAITIKMPVPGKPVGAVVRVYTVSGSTYTLLGNYTVTTAGSVSFPITSLSWKVGDPVFNTAGGGTGTGGGGGSF